MTDLENNDLRTEAESS